MNRNELPPPQNQVIMELVFENLEFTALSVCRQVCKLWYQCSLKAWKSSVKILLNDKSVYRKKMDSFLEYLKTEKKKREYAQCPLVTHFHLEDLTKKYLDFWKTCGSTINVLELQFCKFRSADDFRQIIFKSCPNLNHLTLRCGSLSNDLRVVEPEEYVKPEFGDNKNLKSLTLIAGQSCISYVELLTHFPAIETLNLNTMSRDEVERVFKAVNLIRNSDPEKLPLKRLERSNVTGVNSPQLLKILKDKNLSFESLDVSLCGPSATTCQQQVISLHGESLQKLAFGVKSIFQIHHVDYDYITPVLPSKPLEKLRVLSLRAKSLPTLEFLKFTPNLRKLVLEGNAVFCVTNTNPIDMIGFSIPNFTELEMNDNDILVEDLEKLMDWFPNVKTLKMFRVDNFRLSRICKRWKYLDTLEIKQSAVDEAGISGNIGDLKYLRRFSMRAGDKRDFSFGLGTERDMGYHAAALEIERSTSLKCLFFYNYRYKDETLWKALLKKYPPSYTKWFFSLAY